MSDGLVIRDVSKRFGDFWALQRIRATVPAGRITAFVGPNGAGKTTLLHIIGGTLKPDHGTVHLGIRHITGLPPHVIARLGIGRQFQDVRPFYGMTVFENVMVAALPSSAQSLLGFCEFKQSTGLARRAREAASRWLEYVGLFDKRHSLVEDISPGQQKLMALARLFAAGSRVLLLDEPTAGLDPAMVKRICEVILRAVEQEGITVAMVEHNMAVVADLAYWIHFLHEGQVAFSGERDHVLGNRSVREIYMGLYGEHPVH